MKFVQVFLLLVASSASINGLTILTISPFGSKSHFAIGYAITKSLHEAGHEVIVMSPYPQKKKIPNYHDVDVSSVLEQFEKESIPNPFFLGDMNPVMLLFFLYNFGDNMVNTYMKHPNVLEFMKSNKKTIDVCLIENFNADAFMGIADHFGCTLVTYTTFGAVKWIDDMTSNQSPYSYVPHPYLDYTDSMTFYERLRNTVYSQIENVIYASIHLPNQRKLYKKYFPNAKKTFDEMYKGSSIIFHNNHVSSSTARPYLPNMIEIGGIHVEPAKPLPKDLQEYLDSATDGVILFSMGSMIQAVQWPINQREAFIKAFGKLKQKVIWKYENETLPNKPDNVMIGSWIPQRDILTHPNVKLFITHGGLLGTTEAVVEGVPVFGIPVYGDQKMNIAKAVARGYGLQILREEISEENLSKKLNELLYNPKYQKNAKEISRRFVDRPMTPQQSVVYWTEYAHRHNGAPHLKAAGNSLNYIEFHLIDVYATLVWIGFVFLYIIIAMLKFVFRKIFKKQSAQTKLKKK